MILERMHKISNDKSQKMIYYGLVALMFLLPVPLLFLPDSERGIGVQATLLTLAVFYFGFWIVAERINGRFSMIKSGLAMKCIAGLILVGAVSVLTATDKEWAFYGTELRSEGYLSLLAYYFIFVGTTMLQREEYRKKLLHLFLLLGVIVAILGVIQYTGIYVMGERFPGMGYVPMRNPNFYGAFTVLFTGVGIGGFFSYKKESDTTHPFRWWNRVLWYVLVLFGYAGCICAKSTLVYAGLIMLLLMYLFLELATKRWRLFSFLLLVAGLLLMIHVFNIQKKGDVVAEIKTVENQIKAEVSVTGDSVGSGRMRIWKSAISLLPKYGLLGCGIECLGAIWYTETNVSFDGATVDKVHNEYLNLWITEGFFAIVIYLVFLFSLFIPGLLLFFGKRGRDGGKEEEPARKQGKYDEISKIAFFAFFGYIAQAFFNISVIQVAPYFWMICGLLYSRKRNMNEETMDC